LPVAETPQLRANDREPDNVRGGCDFRDAFNLASVARAAGTAHVTQECLHRFALALHVDEDGAVGTVRDSADHAVAIRGFHDPSAVAYALDATARDAVPVDQVTLRTT
jgi:hypothetical protein